ncbi:MAG TPA: hypothetical protein VME47_02790 [Acetobacteraceae bacterium]|nr:hypothetical protein [Acetobacteraceae bacterium]
MSNLDLNPSPADACSLDTNRDGTGASAPLPERLVRFLVLLILLIREHVLAFRHYSATGLLPSWWNYRPDLPPGSVQQYAASLRGEFGNAIAWMCRRRGIGPGHPDWPELRCAIVMFGGSVKGFRPGLPACGLQWFENPHILPGAFGEIPATPAADVMARMLSQHVVADVPPPALIVLPAKPAPAVLPAQQRKIFARAATGPPTGPPFDQNCQLCYA